MTTATFAVVVLRSDGWATGYLVTCDVNFLLRFLPVGDAALEQKQAGSSLNKHGGA